MKSLVSSKSSKRGAANIFWGEIAPRDHVVHFYEHDDAILDSLAEFAEGGLANDEGVIIMATQAHLEALADRLAGRGVDVAAVQSQDLYIAVDAEALLSTFMIGGWPDEDVFHKTVKSLLARARKQSPRVRAFGELVSIIWSQGHKGATVQLEHLWHRLCESEDFSLYCAYPRVSFAQDPTDSMREICAAHSRVIGGDALLGSTSSASAPAAP